ncbi:MAG: RidA family protein [Planctomycetes bacterium]|nr:RidA family protein [Planctomycetota bacterium]
MKRVISTDRGPKAIGPYSQAVEAGGFLFISGQIPIDPATGSVVGASITDQTDRVLKNIEGILAAEGLSTDHVVKTTVYLVDLTEFGIMNEVYGHYFPNDPPARATVQVAGLPKGVRVEIDAIARKP